MKTSVFGILFMLGCAVNGSAQQMVSIDDLTAPTSPAFILLDTSPAVVERPDNAKTFTLNLLNKVTSAKGLPQNYALELAPYWLASHPTLSFETYQRPSIGQSILQSFTISAATVPIPGATSGADPLGTRLGLGFKVSIKNGQPNSRLEEAVSELADTNGLILDALEVQANPASTQAQRDQAVKDELAARDTAKGQSLAIQGLDAERVGLFLYLAGGRVWAFPGDDVSTREVEKTGIWFTPSYRFRACNGADTCEASIDLIGVARRLVEKDAAGRWDYGARVIWRAKRELYLSIESLHRDALDATATDAASPAADRTVGMLEYRVKSDVVLYGSFGQDFKKDSGITPLVSYFGLNLGFGAKPSVLADKPKN